MAGGVLHSQEARCGAHGWGEDAVRKVRAAVVIETEVKAKAAVVELEMVGMVMVAVVMK